MMTKLLSLVLSFTMIYMSVAPAYAQAAQAQQAAAARQYDSMMMAQCERDAHGNIVAVDFDKPEYQEALRRMLNNPNSWEWRTCSYIEGLRRYYDKHPGRAKYLTAWQREEVIRVAMNNYVQRWNKNPSARENDELRSIFINLNNNIYKYAEIPTRTSWTYDPSKEQFIAAPLENALKQANEEARGAAAASSGSMFGLSGGNANANGDTFLAELEAVYNTLADDSRAQGNNVLSKEEFAELYKENSWYDFAGQIEEQAKQHQNEPGWNNWVEQQTRKRQNELSDKKINEAYKEWQALSEQEIQNRMVAYLAELAREIMSHYRQDPALYIGVVEDVLPLFNMYGALPSDVRAQAQQALRKEIAAYSGKCAVPGFFSMTTLKGLGNMATLHQNKKLQESMKADVVNRNAQCAQAVKAAVALGILGKPGDGSDDSAAIQQLFKEGYNGSSSVMVIPAVISALVTMGAYSDASNMIILAGNETTKGYVTGLLDGMGKSFSPSAWAQVIQSGDSWWYSNARLEYSYYTDENGVQRNVWMDVVDMLAEYYKDADAQTRQGLDGLIAQSMAALLTPSDKALRIGLRPYVAGVLSHGMVDVQLGNKDFGYVSSKKPAILVDLNKITDKKNKKAVQQMFRNAYDSRVSYVGVFAWYLLLSNKKDLHPKMRLYMNERLVRGLQVSGGSWINDAWPIVEEQERQLQNEIKDYNKWMQVMQNLQPLDDLIGLFLLWQGGRGIYSLLKLTVKAAGIGGNSFIQMMRVMRRANSARAAGFGTNLNRLLSLGLKKFNSRSFRSFKKQLFAAESTPMVVNTEDLYYQSTPRLMPARLAGSSAPSGVGTAAAETAAQTAQAADALPSAGPRVSSAVRVQAAGGTNTNWLFRGKTWSQLKPWQQNLSISLMDKWMGIQDLKYLFTPRSATALGTRAMIGAGGYTAAPFAVVWEAPAGFGTSGLVTELAANASRTSTALTDAVVGAERTAVSATEAAAEVEAAVSGAQTVTSMPNMLTQWMWAPHMLAAVPEEPVAVSLMPAGRASGFSSGKSGASSYRLGHAKQLMNAALSLYKEDMYAPQSNWLKAAWNRVNYAGTWMNVHWNPYYKYYVANRLDKMSSAADTDETDTAKHHDDDQNLPGGGAAVGQTSAGVNVGKAEDLPVAAMTAPQEGSVGGIMGRLMEQNTSEEGVWDRLFKGVSASFAENPTLSTLSGLAMALVVMDGMSGGTMFADMGLDGASGAGMTAGLFAFLSPASPFKENTTPGKPNTIKTKNGKITYTYERLAFNPQTQETRVLGEGEAVPDGWNTYTMSSNYNFMASAQGIKGFESSKLAVLYSNTVAKLVLNLAKPARELLVWILASAADPAYKLQAFAKMQELQYGLPSKTEIIAAHTNISATSIAWNEEDLLALQEIVNQRLENDADLTKLLPADQPVLLSGVTPESLAKINQEKLRAALYNTDLIKNFLDGMKVTVTSQGHKKYSGLLPVYVRAENGAISAEPKVYVNLNGMTFVVPRGFMVVMDELGQIKFVPQDLREVDDVSAMAKLWESLASVPVLGSLLKFVGLNAIRDKSLRLLNSKSSDRHIVFEQPLSASELAGLSRVLSANEGNNNLTAVLDLREKDAFPNLMFLLSMIAGADLGASMSSQFKAVMPFAVLAILISGFGYFSPIVANWFKSAINKHGYYKTVRASLVAMLGISALATFTGLNWNFDFKTAPEWQQGLGILFAVSAITIASILSTVASPIMKGAYPDATVFASKNMGFTTSKGLARLIVTVAPVLLGMGLGNVLGDANWSSLIPVMGLVTVAALVQLQRSRLATENVNSNAKASSITKQEAKEIYKEKFSKSLSSMVRRVALVYMTYAVINSVMLGGEMGMLYSKDMALLITASGLFLSWLVRKGADQLIKNKTITDDELTGMGLPLMALGVGSYLVSPAGSAGMWLAWLMMYLSTPVFGVVENSRMQNAVARYYAQSREAVTSDYLKHKEEVQNDASLSAKDKDEKLKELDAEKDTLLKGLTEQEKVIKMEASGSYNKANSMGLVSIIILAGLFAVFKDWSPEMVGSINDFFRSFEAGFEPGVMDNFMAHNADPANAAKQKDILDFAIYRLGAVLPLVFSLALLATNKGMVKDGFNRLTQSVVLTQEDIDSGKDVLGKLRFDNDQAATYIDRVQKELQELGKMVDIGVKSFMSETRFFQPIVNRLVWVNNRLNALMRASNVAPSVLNTQLQSLRQITNVLRALVNNNDVSEDFRHQVEALTASVDTIKVDTDARGAQLINSLEAYRGVVGNEEYAAKIQDIAGYIARGDKERLQLAFAAVEKMLVDRKVLKRNSKELNALKHQMNAVVAAMEDGVGKVTSVTLNYLPEVKLSFVAWLSALMPWSDPSKGIFSGTETDDYEHSKLFVNQLRKMSAEKSSGKKPRDGDRQAFLAYYVAAKLALKNYIKAVGHQEERVNTLNKELDGMLDQYMGTLTAAERKQVEGVLSEDEAVQLATLENWMEELGEVLDSLGEVLQNQSPTPQH